MELSGLKNFGGSKTIVMAAQLKMYQISLNRTLTVGELYGM